MYGSQSPWTGLREVGFGHGRHQRRGQNRRRGHSRRSAQSAAAGEIYRVKIALE